MTCMIVDYGRGNLFSLTQALRHLGVEHEVTTDPARLARAERLVLPGVGAFGDAAAALRKRGLAEPLLSAVGRGGALLGICVGAQLLFTRGEEFGVHAGLDLLGGTVRRLPEGNGGPDSVRIPNVGWRTLLPRPLGFLADIPADSKVYFVHSYAPIADDPSDVVATIHINGAEVTAAVRRGRVLGYQFHPEKSGEVGLDILSRFMAL